jgi:hypothetical protein
MATSKQQQQIGRWKVPTDWHEERFEKVEVTPEIAQFIYDLLGDFNRKISPDDPKVQEYADDMKHDRWGKIGTVEFDWDGHLGNGYHRMLAVILAGVTVTMWFAYGKDPADYVGYDKGKNRDGKNVFEIEAKLLGEKITTADAKLMSSALPWIIQYECGKASLPFRVTSFVQRDFYRRRLSVKKGEDFKIREQLPLARKAAKKIKVAESVVWALIVLGQRTDNKITATEQFWKGVATGANLPDNDPRLMLINRLQNIRDEVKGLGIKIQRGVVYQLGLKCMRAYFDGEKIGNLTMPKKIVRLSSEHDEMFGEVDFRNPEYPEAATFDDANVATMTELIEKHEGRGLKKVKKS